MTNQPAEVRRILLEALADLGDPADTGEPTSILAGRLAHIAKAHAEASKPSSDQRIANLACIAGRLGALQVIDSLLTEARPRIANLLTRTERVYRHRLTPEEGR